MDLTSLLKRRIKAARKRQSAWVQALDIARLLATSEGRARLWTKLRHGAEVHQTTPQTAEDRYPELFDFIAGVMPAPARILSFGCSTGEELSALRSRFPAAELVGAEINGRSRKIAARRMADDPRSRIVAPDEIDDQFDIVLALAVLQREPHKIAEMEVEDLTPFYPFFRFDAGVVQLAGRVRRGGLLCVANAHYRVEDSTASTMLEPLRDAPSCSAELFGADGMRLAGATAASVFRKC